TLLTRGRSTPLRGSPSSFRAVLMRLLSGLAILMALPAAAQRPQETLAPLAYVRTLAVTAPQLTPIRDMPLPPKPIIADKKAQALWEKRRRDREEFIRLREQAVRDFSAALSARLARLPGL